MRERFDAGTGLVALGAVLLLVSLFVDWYEPSGDAWAVFEVADILLALCAVAALVALVPRYAALSRAMPAIAYGALFVVAVQVVDPPPAARGDSLAAGAWLALGATVLMAIGATLSAASISVTVDVRGRDRRPRTSAIDAREAREPAEAPPPPEAAEPDPEPEPRRGRRRPGAGTPPAAPSGAVAASDGAAEEPPADPDRTQAIEPIERPKDDA